MTSLSNERKVFETTAEIFYNWTLNWYNEHAYGVAKKPSLKYKRTWDSFVESIKLQRPVIETNEFLEKTIIIYFDAIVKREYRNGATNLEDPFPAFSFRVVPLRSEEIEVEIIQNFDAPEIAPIKDSIWKDVLSSFKTRKTIQNGDPIIQPQEPEKPRKLKKKIPDLPTRRADAYKWVLAWELIGSKINDDPTLKIGIDELIQYLKLNNLAIKEDTLRKIITRGRVGKIPSRTEFERKNQM